MNHEEKVMTYEEWVSLTWKVVIITFIIAFVLLCLGIDGFNILDYIANFILKLNFSN